MRPKPKPSGNRKKGSGPGGGRGGSGIVGKACNKHKTCKPTSRQNDLKSKRNNTKDNVSPKGNSKATKNADGSWTVRLERKGHWSKKDFRKKAQILKRHSDKGTLKSGPAHRGGSSQTNARRKLERRIDKDQKATNKDIDNRHKRGNIDDAQRDKEMRTAQGNADRSYDRLKHQEMDHYVDLQVGGKDGPGNIGPVENITNHGMGGQIRNQLQNSGIQPGDAVNIEVTKW